MNALQLGGVWADWQERLEAAEARASSAQESEESSRLEAERLGQCYSALKNDFDTLTNSLTSMTLADKNNLEILEIIKNEKFNLEKRLAGLEAQREYQDRVDAQLKDRIVDLEVECKDWLDRVDKQMMESDEQKRMIASLQQALARSEQTNEALRAQGLQKDETIATLQHSVDTKSRQLQVLCKERDRLKAENVALAKASALPRQPSNKPAPSSSPSGFSTPCKAKDKSPVSVVTASSALSPSPQSPSSVDPYSWLLDSRPPSSPAAEKGGQKEVAQLLKRMISSP